MSDVIHVFIDEHWSIVSPIKQPAGPRPPFQSPIFGTNSLATAQGTYTNVYYALLTKSHFEGESRSSPLCESWGVEMNLID